jgi:hypothetical protein
VDGILEEEWIVEPGSKAAAATELLAELVFGDKYDALLKHAERKPGVRDLPDHERKTYQAEAVRKHREKLKAMKTAGNPEPTRDAVREAMADAALMLLAVGGPGADQVRAYLERAFPGRPGVAMTVTSRARSGKLRPTSLKVS